MIFHVPATPPRCASASFQANILNTTRTLFYVILSSLYAIFTISHKMPLNAAIKNDLRLCLAWRNPFLIKGLLQNSLAISKSYVQKEYTSN